jgi:DNA-binding NarL/FixJ family response regulator
MSQGLPLQNQRGCSKSFDDGQDDGASGIVLKSPPLEEVESAVLRVAAGDNYLDEKIVKNLSFFASRSLGEHHALN